MVPAYCEEDNVRPFHDSVTAALDGVDFDIEFVFVNDGSTDGTDAALAKLAEGDQRVRVLRFARNFGAHAAITAGLHCAAGDAVVIISIDGQDPPTLILQMVEQWRQGASVVWSARDGRDDPFMKKLLANTFYGLFRRIAFADIPRGGMDTGLFDRSVVNVFRRIKDHEVVPIYAIFSLGFDSTTIPYRRLERRRGASGWPLRKRLRVAVDLITCYSYVPIRLISLVGLIGSLTALILGSKVIYDRLVLGLGDSDWPSLAALVLFVGSVQMLMVGIVAEYVWRTARQVRGYPRYVVVEDNRDGVHDDAPPTPVDD